MTTKQYRAASIAIEDAMYAAAVKACKKRQLDGEDAFLCVSNAIVNVAAGVIVAQIDFRDATKESQVIDEMVLEITETIRFVIEGMLKEAKP